MAKLDFKLVMIVLALALLVTLLSSDADALSSRRRYTTSRRRYTTTRRRTSFGSRRRSSYGSTRSRVSTGLVTGLVIFGVFAVLIIVGFVIGCYCCRAGRRRTAGSIVTSQPRIQYRTEYQTGTGSEPPPYTPFGAAYSNPKMSQSPYPPLVKNNSEVYPPPAGAPPMTYPTTDSASPLPYPSDVPNQPPYPPPGDNLPYPSNVQTQPSYPPPGDNLPYASDVQNQPPYPPPGDSSGIQAHVPPQEAQNAAAAQFPAQVPPGVEASAPPLPPPSYDEVVKESQGGTRNDETPR